MKSVLVLAGTLLAFCSTSAAEVRIGMLTDLSVKMAVWGQQAVAGAELARDDLKAEGIDVTLIVEDHALDPKRAVSSVHKLLTGDNVHAVYSEFSTTCAAISPIVLSAKKILIYDAGMSEILKTNPYSFKSFIDYVGGCRAVAQLWKNEGLTKIGTLKVAAEPGELCLSGAQQVFPDMFEMPYTMGDDVSAQMLQLKQRGAEGVLNAALDPDFRNMLRAAANMNYWPRIGVNENGVSAEAETKYPQALPQLTMIGLPAVSEEFRIKIREKGRGEQNIEAAALAYVHVKQLVRAVKACPDDISCQHERVLSAPPDGTIGFEGWNDRQARFKTTLRGFRQGKRVQLN